MKAALFTLCLFLAACAAPQPLAQTGKFIITEYASNGGIKQTWTANSFVEQDFPPRITFTSNGMVINLTGSWQVDEF